MLTTVSVVLLITDNNIEPVLNPSEVTQLFSMPLAAFLYTRPSRIPGWHYGISTRIRSVTHPVVGDPPPIRFADAQGAVGIEGSDTYYNWRDVSFANGSIVRMHRFLTGREAEASSRVRSDRVSDPPRRWTAPSDGLQSDTCTRGGRRLRSAARLPGSRGRTEDYARARGP